MGLDFVLGFLLAIQQAWCLDVSRCFAEQAGPNVEPIEPSSAGTQVHSIVSSLVKGRRACKMMGRSLPKCLPRTVRLFEPSPRPRQVSRKDQGLCASGRLVRGQGASIAFQGCRTANPEVRSAVIVLGFCADIVAEACPALQGMRLAASLGDETPDGRPLMPAWLFISHTA